MLVQVCYVGREVPSTLKYLSCLTASFSAQHPAEMCLCLLQAFFPPCVVTWQYYHRFHDLHILQAPLVPQPF